MNNNLWLRSAGFYAHLSCIFRPRKMTLQYKWCRHIWEGQQKLEPQPCCLLKRDCHSPLKSKNIAINKEISSATDAVHRKAKVSLAGTYMLSTWKTELSKYKSSCPVQMTMISKSTKTNTQRSIPLWVARKVNEGRLIVQQYWSFNNRNMK